MNSKGYLPHHIIKGFVFWILSVCLIAATLAGILLRWGAIGELVAGRCLWTAFILALGSVGFLTVNYLFGDLGGILFGHGSSSPKVDPAFAERLKAAKVAGQPRSDLNDSDQTIR